MSVDVTHLFAGIAVTDFAAACDWYERLFDSPPDAFLAVKNLDDRRADLARCGLRVAEGAESNGMRTLTVADPDGNTIKFFEDPAGRPAHRVGS